MALRVAPRVATTCGELPPSVLGIVTRGQRSEAELGCCISEVGGRGRPPSRDRLCLFPPSSAALSWGPCSWLSAPG